MRLARVNYGAQKQASAESETRSPENKERFRGIKSNQTRMSLSPSYIQTILSALEFTASHYIECGAVSPSHARERSWALPPIGNSLRRSVTLPRRLNI